MNRGLAALALSLAGCGQPVAPPVDTCEGPRGLPHAVEYDLRLLPDSLIWYRGTPLQDLDDYPQDDRGVILFDLDGRYIYNTIQVAQKGLWFVANYEQTGDGRHLQRAVAHAARLLQDADVVEGAL